MSKNTILISSCLLGFNCRYDGKNQKREEMIKLLQNENIIPICGEQMGGLSTPRMPAEIIEDKIFTRDGKDVTENYNRGANEILKIAILSGANVAYLKTKSPMCGCGKIYDGSFTGNLIDGDGILTKLLKENHIKVIPIQ